MFDKANSGKISAAQLRTILTTYGERMSDTDFDEFIREAEIDADGNVNYAEFVKYLVSK